MDNGHPADDTTHVSYMLQTDAITGVTALLLLTRGIPGPGLT
jgi:hypothetical protein